MNRLRWLVWLRVAFVVIATPLIFVLTEAAVRSRELRLDLWFLSAAGIHGVPAVIGTSALLQPAGKPEFWVYLSPSCSSLASILTLGCIASVLPRHLAPGKNRLLAFLAASAAVFVGNLLRIDLSICAGLIAGQAALVLFHDWAGSIFGFAYTMGGFVLMMWILLPAGGRSSLPASQPSSRSAEQAAPAAPAVYT